MIVLHYSPQHLTSEEHLFQEILLPKFLILLATFVLGFTSRLTY